MGEIIYVVFKSYFYSIFILSLVFHLCDILSFTLEDGHRQRVFGNSTVKKIFVPNGEEETGAGKIL
jgi:hypothetical protein